MVVVSGIVVVTGIASVVVLMAKNISHRYYFEMPVVWLHY